MRLYNNGFFAGAPQSRSTEVRLAIRKKVLAEYKTEFEEAVGWQKIVVKWKVDLVVEIRYRGILFMGAAATLPEDFN